ncbi:MAG: hypothetical protein AAFO94_06905 [Bacteroidota bacterium]
MSKLLTLVLVISILAACQPSPSPAGWQLVFRNDENGKVRYGDKSKLVDAVRRGYSIRVGWGGHRPGEPGISVEHVADAQFLTITNAKEVFAQITPIIGQRPDLTIDTTSITFRQNIHWTIMMGTNGFSDRLNVDYLADTIAGHRSRPLETSWYVEYPAAPVSGASGALWGER